LAGRSNLLVKFGDCFAKERLAMAHRTDFAKHPVKEIPEKSFCSTPFASFRATIFAANRLASCSLSQRIAATAGRVPTNPQDPAPGDMLIFGK